MSRAFRRPVIKASEDPREIWKRAGGEKVGGETADPPKPAVKPAYIPEGEPEPKTGSGSGAEPNTLPPAPWSPSGSPFIVPPDPGVEPVGEPYDPDHEAGGRTRPVWEDDEWQRWLTPLTADPDEFVTAPDEVGVDDDTGVGDDDIAITDQAQIVGVGAAPGWAAKTSTSTFGARVQAGRGRQRIR